MSAKDLLGSWRLESFEEVSAAGDHLFPLGKRPRGLLSYTPDGMMSVHLLASIDPDQTEMPPYTGYFGSYTVHTSRAVIGHHIEAASAPGLAGTTQERRYGITGNRLTLAALFGGSVFSLVWRR